MNLKNILFGMLLTIAAFPVWGSDVSVNTDGSVNLPYFEDFKTDDHISFSMLSMPTTTEGHGSIPTLYST